MVSIASGSTPKSKLVESEHKDNLENALPPGVLQFLAQPRADQLKHKIVQLEMENKNLKTQLEGLKSRLILSRVVVKRDSF